MRADLLELRVHQREGHRRVVSGVGVGLLNEERDDEGIRYLGWGMTKQDKYVSEISINTVGYKIKQRK